MPRDSRLRTKGISTEAPPAGGAGGRRARHLAILACGLAAITLSWLAWHSHWGAARPAPPRPGEDFKTVLALVNDHHYLASLPYLRRAISATQDDFMELHLTLAVHLSSATFEVRQRPWPVRGVRSSIERIRMMREAIAEMERAGDFPLDSIRTGYLYERYGAVMQIWGFNWEALRSYRSAQRWSAEYAMRADDFMNRMHEPRSAPGPVQSIP